MPSEPFIFNNESATLCGACGGECCRTRPGIEAPGRFLAAPDPAGHLRDLLASGLWVLDTHYGVPYDPAKGERGDPDLIIRYPRPATRPEQESGGISALPGAGECVFLRADGCALPFADRPRACQALEPTAGFDCSSSWTRFDAARAWLPHQDTVAAALTRLSRPPL
ncbi:hypothetical protein [Geobacter pickeringii]|uniref:Uncharacterized protein n=1 Tax=Geobacter pickeringii TaxID=345632 RepID=A0A0B5BBD7_9BACT|nr:hypothetical protein [Geobacter pickeringii]AJE04098.1 hypothetical protein GPICK_12665 [Geobacter pickeringii]